MAVMTVRNPIGGLMEYDTRDCLTCGHPSCDHLDKPLRYVLRPWVRHYLLSKLAVLSKGWR